MPEMGARLELPLLRTLLARRMNFVKPLLFSSGGPDPPGAEELMMD